MSEGRYIWVGQGQVELHLEPWYPLDPKGIQNTKQETLVKTGIGSIRNEIPRHIRQ